MLIKDQRHSGRKATAGCGRDSADFDGNRSAVVIECLGREGGLVTYMALQPSERVCLAESLGTAGTPAACGRLSTFPCLRRRCGCLNVNLGERRGIWGKGGKREHPSCGSQEREGGREGFID